MLFNSKYGGDVREEMLLVAFTYFLCGTPPITLPRKTDIRMYAKHDNILQPGRRHLTFLSSVANTRAHIHNTYKTQTLVTCVGDRLVAKIPFFGINTRCLERE